MIEFALAFPLMMVLILGTMGGSYVMFQNAAVANGARGGSRWAVIETALSSKTIGTHKCESGIPGTVVTAIRATTNVVPLNAAPLCAVSATELQQMPVNPAQANIVVDALPNLTAPTCVTVSITYVTTPFATPFRSPLTLRNVSSAFSPTAVGSPACPAAGSPDRSLVSGP